MSKTIGIVGAGNMGQAIAWAMEKLGYELVVLDRYDTAIQSCKKLLQENHNFFHSGSWKQYLFGCSAIISSLPYHRNLDLAVFCIDHAIPYFDLGGSVEISKDIHSYAQANATRPVLTDLGLAPGWANIIAEDMYQQWVLREGEPPETITMMVGGLPQHPNNTLRYTCTWSYDGLVNEYRSDCIVLIDGKQVAVRGLDGYQFPVVSEIGVLEAFYTSGGAAHTIDTMRERGVQNCSYKTLRYPQHRRFVNFLIHESGLSDDTITEVFKRTCPSQEDLVIIKVTAKNLVKGDHFEKVIRSNAKFSAMQQATALPAASAAHTILEDEVSKSLPVLLKYADLNAVSFNATLDTLLIGH